MCRASLERLGIEKTGLYMQHWPGILTNGPFNDAFVEGLGDCARLGLTQAVGVSNFSPERVRRASSILQACPYQATGELMSLSGNWGANVLTGNMGS